MIEQRKLKELIKLMVENDLTELDLQGKDERVTLKRGAPQPQPIVVPQPTLPEMRPAGSSDPVAASPQSGGSGQADQEGLVTIGSPMVGTFYAAPSPDAQSFVKIGSTVDLETVVCVVEAMKVFNEIKAEVTGEICKILVENGQAIEFDQPLFLVKPA